jgi:myo-inositol 2-dehydrogenase/D-chiro-inositol 1-dehydrogenase
LGFLSPLANIQGARHAQNVVYRTPRAELLSICDPRSDILESMRSKLPASVEQFKSADECLDQKGLEAVLIASETSLHAELAKKAMDRGLVSVLSHDIDRVDG